MPTATASPPGAAAARARRAAAPAPPAPPSAAACSCRAAAPLPSIPAAGQTQTLSNAIADQTGSGGTGGNAGSWALSKTGAGTLVLGGTNTYTGGTNVTGGTLSISADANLGKGGTVALGRWHRHRLHRRRDLQPFDHGGGRSDLHVGTGLTVTQSGQIADGATPGDVEVKGGGTLVLSNALNSYSGGTTGQRRTLQHRHGRQPGSNRRAHRQWRHLQSQ